MANQSCLYSLELRIFCYRFISSPTHVKMDWLGPLIKAVLTKHKAKLPIYLLFNTHTHKFHWSSVERWEIFHTKSWYILRAMVFKQKHVNASICEWLEERKKRWNWAIDQMMKERIEYSMAMARFYEIKSSLYLMMHSLNFRLANWCLILLLFFLNWDVPSNTSRSDRYDIIEWNYSATTIQNLNLSI